MIIACFHNLLKEPRGCVDSLRCRGTNSSVITVRVLVGREREREREAPRDATLPSRARERLVQNL